LEIRPKLDAVVNKHNGQYMFSLVRLIDSLSAMRMTSRLIGLYALVLMRRIGTAAAAAATVFNMLTRNNRAASFRAGNRRSCVYRAMRKAMCDSPHERARGAGEARCLKSAKEPRGEFSYLAVAGRRRRRRHPTAITPLCEFARFAYFRKRCTGKHKQLRSQRERRAASSSDELHAWKIYE